MGAGQGNPGHDLGSMSDFANYRIKWTADIESFFQKKLHKKQSRKLVQSGDEESEDERHYDPDQKIPIRKPTPPASLGTSNAHSKATSR